MTIIDALILGIIQGLTEFLPISSSGHLVIGQELLGITIPGNHFEVMVHLGTLCSVITIFRFDIWQLLKTLTSSDTKKYIGAIIIGTIPAVIFGLVFKDLITASFDNIKIVALTLLITGLVLLSTKFVKHGSKNISIGRGFIIGIAQAIAIIPGISRSGMTISMGLFLGIKSEKAAKFSFLLAIPAIAGAGVLTSLDLSEPATVSLNWVALLTGFLSSYIVGAISLKWLLGLIETGKFHWFGVYCIFIGFLTWLI